MDKKIDKQHKINVQYCRRVTDGLEWKFVKTGVHLKPDTKILWVVIHLFVIPAEPDRNI